MSNKTSDKNVANDIKILNKFCEYEDAVILTDNALEEVQDAMKDILAEREQKDKRIQELEKENEELLEVKISCSAVNIIENLQKENESKQKAYDDCYCEYKKYKQFESIAKEKVIEAFEDIEDYFDRLNGPDEDMDYIRQVKQELLEGRNENG